MAADAELIQTILNWINGYAEARRLSLTVYPEAVETVGSWYHVPVRIHDQEGVYERTQMLQRIEDAWNDAPPKENVHLLLVPAPSRHPASDDWYQAQTELLERQKMLLDQYDALGHPASVQQSLQIRQEWEQVMKRMERLWPQDQAA